MRPLILVVLSLSTITAFSALTEATVVPYPGHLLVQNQLSVRSGGGCDGAVGSMYGLKTIDTPFQYNLNVNTTTCQIVIRYIDAATDGTVVSTFYLTQEVQAIHAGGPLYCAGIYAPTCRYETLGTLSGVNPSTNCPVPTGGAASTDDPMAEGVAEPMTNGPGNPCYVGYLTPWHKPTTYENLFTSEVGLTNTGGAGMRVSKCGLALGLPIAPEITMGNIACDVHQYDIVHVRPGTEGTVVGVPVSPGAELDIWLPGH